MCARWEALSPNQSERLSNARRAAIADGSAPRPVSLLSLCGSEIGWYRPELTSEPFPTGPTCLPHAVLTRGVFGLFDSGERPGVRGPEPRSAAGEATGRGDRVVPRRRDHSSIPSWQSRSGHPGATTETTISRSESCPPSCGTWRTTSTFRTWAGRTTQTAWTPTVSTAGKRLRRNQISSSACGP